MNDFKSDKRCYTVYNNIYKWLRDWQTDQDTCMHATEYKIKNKANTY